MSNVKRVYVEKKPEFAVTAKGLGHEIRHYLGIKDVTGVRVLIRYDAENISDETFEKAQEILRGRHDAFNLSHERQSNKHLFSTLIKCKECALGMFWTKRSGSR